MIHTSPIAQSTEVMSHHLPDLVCTDHRFEVPLRHADAQGPYLSVYAREVTSHTAAARNLPWLLFLQGGPGYGAPRPVSAAGWLGHAVQHYRVLLLDQRGTGLSTPVDAASLTALGSAEAQADYLSYFRADSIVADAELIRAQLSPGQPWTLLGQSFGGFCALNYLSAQPQGLAAALITGGIPPIGTEVDDVYRATYQRVHTRNERYYQRYPEDAQRMADVCDYLRKHRVTMPGGSQLTPEVLQLLGLSFGFSDGFESVHYLLEEAFTTSAGGVSLSFAFLQGVEQALPYDRYPIFSLLQEALYCQHNASQWSAHRVRAEFPQFDANGHEPIYFTGEMMYPWMYETFAQLRPLQAAAEQLALRSDWPQLYNEQVLAANTVPTVAAVYAQDMYVEREFSQAVAERVPHMQAWITDEWDHNALRADGEAQVFKQLLRMLAEAS